MATGYTVRVANGELIDFREFAMSCSRAFGVLADMRDMALDAKIPEEIIPSPYHKEKIALVKKELKKVQKMTDEEIELTIDTSYKASLTSYADSVLGESEEMARYGRMLQQVLAWQPPTPDHEGLKKFMINQLSESIRFDCFVPDAPSRMTVEEFRADRVRFLMKEFEYHQEESLKEEKSAREKTAWLKALRESLYPVKE